MRAVVHAPNPFEMRPVGLRQERLRRAGKPPPYPHRRGYRETDHVGENTPKRRPAETNRPLQTLPQRCRRRRGPQRVSDDVHLFICYRKNRPPYIPPWPPPPQCARVLRLTLYFSVSRCLCGEYLLRPTKAPPPESLPLSRPLRRTSPSPRGRSAPWPDTSSQRTRAPVPMIF